MSDLLESLQCWYASQCDDVWEHSFGIEIKNIDNPGWKVRITGASEKQVLSMAVERSEEDWVQITATDSEFVGYGGANNLRELMALAVNWLEVG